MDTTLDARPLDDMTLDELRDERNHVAHHLVGYVSGLVRERAEGGSPTVDTLGWLALARHVEHYDAVNAAIADHHERQAGPR